MNKVLKYIAVIRADGTGRVLTVGDSHIRRTVDHEAKVNKSVIIGEYTDPRTAEKAARLAERGWRQAAERRTGT